MVALAESECVLRRQERWPIVAQSLVAMAVLEGLEGLLEEGLARRRSILVEMAAWATGAGMAVRQ